MRAREFVINVPITIKINGNDDPEIDVADAKDDDELDLNPVMVPPLQQDLELKKASIGKNSPIIQDLTQDEKDADEEKQAHFFKR